ncbi:MAG: hypothetical protein RR851_11695, partial [Clostridium sp.]
RRWFLIVKIKRVLKVILRNKGGNARCRPLGMVALFLFSNNILVLKKVVYSFETILKKANRK